MKEASLIFPNQLFESVPNFPKNSEIYLIEEYLFFSQYNFHKQKIAFHRASMKYYENYLTEQGFRVNYIEGKTEKSDVRILLQELIKSNDVEILHIIDPVDDYLTKRIKGFESKIAIHFYDSPLFLNSRSDLNWFFKSDKKKFFQTHLENSLYIIYIYI